MRHALQLIFLISLVFWGVSATAQDAVTPQQDEKVRIAREGTAKDFDIRGIKVTMSIDEMIKYAESQGWNYSKKENYINTLIMCPKNIDCNLIMRDEPSGTFRLEARYRNDTLYDLAYETNVTSNFDEISKLILSKYGKPLKQNPRDKSEYWYGVNTEALKDNSKLQDYRNFLRHHVFEIRISGRDKGTPNENYTLYVHLSNPPKIDTEALKPLQPAL